MAILGLPAIGKTEAFGAGLGRELQPSPEVVGSPQGPTAGEPWRGDDLCRFAVEPGRFLSVPGIQLMAMNGRNVTLVQVGVDDCRCISTWVELCQYSNTIPRSNFLQISKWRYLMVSKLYTYIYPKIGCIYIYIIMYIIYIITHTDIYIYIIHTYACGLIV